MVENKSNSKSILVAYSNDRTTLIEQRITKEGLVDKKGGKKFKIEDLLLAGPPEMFTEYSAHWCPYEKIYNKMIDGDSWVYIPPIILVDGRIESQLTGAGIPMSSLYYTCVVPLKQREQGT